MTSSFNNVSTLVEQQLPRFIREDHPVFVEFLQKYYEFLEQPGNPVYELKKFEDNYDIDATRESLLKYFKSKILPSFPEKSELTTERIIKASRDFYEKKGTADSFKFLFKILYDKDVEVYFPKLQILKASDGKWMQPQAFRISLAPNPLKLVDIYNGGVLRCSPELSFTKNIEVGNIIEVTGAAEGSGFLVGYTDPGPKSYYVTSVTKQDDHYYFTLSETMNGSTATTNLNILQEQSLSYGQYYAVKPSYDVTTTAYDGVDVPAKRYTITRGQVPRAMFIPKVKAGINYEFSYYFRYNGNENLLGTLEFGIYSVDLTTNKITILNHGLTTGQAKKYYSNGSTPLATTSGNIADGTTVYVIVVDEDTIQLATSAANATLGRSISFRNTGNDHQYITNTNVHYDGDNSVFYFEAYRGSPESTSSEPVNFNRSNVNISTGIITVANHGLVTGQPKIYSSTDSIAGLTNGTMYFVIRIDKDNFKLASSYANAIANVAITINFSPLIFAASSSAVNTSTGEITFSAPHQISKNGYAIKYEAFGGGWISGLVNGTTYYAIVTGTNKIKLATTYENATATTPVPISNFNFGPFTISTTIYPDTDIITFTSVHGAQNGYPIKYDSNGGAAITGLTSGKTYYVVRVDNYRIKLAETYENAIAATPVVINLQSVGNTNQIFGPSLGNNNQRFVPGAGNDSQFLYGFYNAGRGTRVGIDYQSVYTVKYLKDGWYKLTYPFKFDYLNKNSNCMLQFGIRATTGASTVSIPTTGVDLTNERITINNHGFVTGQAVAYYNGGSTGIGGLTHDDIYYIIVVDSNTIKLATTYLESQNDINIPLSTSQGNNNQYFTVSPFIAETFDVYSAKLTASDTNFFFANSYGLNFLNLSKSASNVDLEKLEKKRARGSISKASCVVESAVRSIDKNTYQEIVELYVSSLTRFFQNGEYLEIEYTDDNGQKQLFSEKIIGALSNIKVNPKRRGRKYKTGDPVIISGGLDQLSSTKSKAKALVGNTTVGGIDHVNVVESGFGFRRYPDSAIEFLTDVGYGANLIVSEVHTDVSNTITLNYCTDSILYKKNAMISNLSEGLLLGSQGAIRITAAFPSKTLRLNTKTALSTSFYGVIDDDLTSFKPGIVLHVKNNPSVSLEEGMVLTAAGIPTGTYIVGQKTPNTSLGERYGGIGRYIISTNVNRLKEFAGYITDCYLNVTSSILYTDSAETVPGGLQQYDYITGGGLGEGSYIWYNLSADPNDTGNGSKWMLGGPVKANTKFNATISGTTLTVASTPTNSILLETDYGKPTRGTVKAGSTRLYVMDTTGIATGQIITIDGANTGGTTLTTTVAAANTTKINVLTTDTDRLFGPGWNALGEVRSTVTVSPTDDTIAISPFHVYANGDPIRYLTNGGAAIGGIYNERIYYAIKVDNYRIKLATTYADAIATTPVPIDLTSIGNSSQLFTNRANIINNTTDLKAPDNSYNATRLDRNTNINSVNGFYWDKGSNGNVTVGQTYTASVYVRASTAISGCTLRFNKNSTYTTFNMTTSWTRVTLTGTMTACATGINGFEVFVPFGTGKAYFWGAQLEKASSVSDYDSSELPLINITVAASTEVIKSPVKSYSGTDMYVFGTSGSTSIPWNTRIIRQLTGTRGGIGTYQLSQGVSMPTTFEATAANRIYFQDDTPIKNTIPQLRNYLHAQANKYYSNWGFSNNSMSELSTQIGRSMSFEEIELGSIRQIKVVNSGGGYSEMPRLNVYGLYETDYTYDEGVGDKHLIKINPYEFGYEPTTFKLELFESASSIQNSLPKFSMENGFYVGWRIWVEHHFRVVTDYTVYQDKYTLQWRKILTLNRPFESNINQISIKYKDIYMDARSNISWMGRIGLVKILNAGIGYSAGETLKIVGSGIGATGYISSVNGAGGITGITLTSRGEGYPEPPTILINTSSGADASIQSFLMADGEDLEAVTTSIGQIMDINIISRGSDYIEAPNVSLRVCDIFMDSIPDNETIVENDLVYQGINYTDGNYRAVVDSYDRANNIVRVFNYSGLEAVDKPIYFTRSGSITSSSIIRNKEVNILDKYGVTLYKKKYPWRYGDGKAKANAEFLNGLIKYNGYYINTDGHVSADKRIQDSHKYHNFSYALASEMQFTDYEKTIADVVHPMGTKMIPITVKSYGELVGESISINVESSILSTNTLIGTCNVGFNTTLVDGGANDAENFDYLADPGDMIHINPFKQGRELNFFKQIVGKVGLEDTKAPTVNIYSGGSLTADRNYYIYVVAYDAAGNHTKTFFNNFDDSDPLYIYELDTTLYSGKQNFNWVRSTYNLNRIEVSWEAVAGAAYYEVWVNPSSYKHNSESWYKTVSRITTTNLNITTLSDSTWVDSGFPPLNNTTLAERQVGENYVYIESPCTFVGDGRADTYPKNTTVQIYDNSESVATKILPSPFISDAYYFEKKITAGSSTIRFRARIDNGSPGVAGEFLTVLDYPSFPLYPGLAVTYIGVNTNKSDIEYDSGAFGAFAAQGSGDTHPVILEELISGEAGGINSIWKINRSTLLKGGTTAYHPLVAAGIVDVINDNLSLFKGPYSEITDTNGDVDRFSWNVEGWDTYEDLENVSSRTYAKLSTVLGNNIEINISKKSTITNGTVSVQPKVGNYCRILSKGSVNWYSIGAQYDPPVGAIFKYNGTAITGTGEMAVATQLIMKDNVYNKYYMMQFTEWGRRGYGDVAYFRNAIDPDYTLKADRFRVNIGVFNKTANLTVGAGNTTTTVNINTSNFIANTTIDDYYTGMILRVLNQPSGVNTATIVSYNAATRLATVSPALSTAPGATSNISIATSGEIYKSIVSVSGSSITLNNYAGIHTTKSNLLYEVVPTLNVVEYEIIKTGYVPD